MAHAETAHPPAAPPQRGFSLFWRTFLWLAVLLLGSIVAWSQTFRTLEETPRALQSARQLASLVNLTRAALMHADAIARVSLVKTLVDEENVRIAVREPTDTFLPHNTNAQARHVSQTLTERLGPKTVVAREVNGFAGLWIGFAIGPDTYWLLVDPERIDTIGGLTWLVWLSIAVSLSLLGALAITRLINHPLKQLSAATARVRDGEFRAMQLDEAVPTTEIREVNIGFNRMAEQLAQAEADRTLMLAGISHDLRTPLARLRLETEMSVADPATRDLMAADIEQADAIIGKFMDYARAGRPQLEPLDVGEAVHAAVQRWSPQPGVELHAEAPVGLRVPADAVELRRLIDNLLENALRYGRSADGVARLEVTVKAQASGVTLTVRDHGPGVPPHLLPRLTEPFFRVDTARTAAYGAGLGLALAQKTAQRMDAHLGLANHPDGGLVIRLEWHPPQDAPTGPRQTR